jgi:2'-5' RNA ligase
LSEPTPSAARVPVIVTHRLFFAAWPLPAVRQALAERVDRLPAGLGRLQRPDQWHVTLEFLGAVPAERLAAALEAGATAAASGRPCEVLFDAIEYWRRPQVLCLTARETPGALSGLVQSLRNQLQARGFEPERREYRAHLTVARKVPRPPGELPLDPLCWPVGGVALVESITDRAGARYEPRATWPLQG